MNEGGLAFEGEQAALACVGEDGLRGKAGQVTSPDRILRNLLEKTSRFKELKMMEFKVVRGF